MTTTITAALLLSAAALLVCLGSGSYSVQFVEGQNVQFMDPQQQQGLGGEGGQQGEGEEEEPEMKSVRYLTTYQPKHVETATEDSLFSLRKKYDVVAVFATQHYNCPTCGEYHWHFINASNRTLSLQMDPERFFFADIAKKVKFTILDADDEGSELEYLLGDMDGDQDEDEIEAEERQGEEKSSILPAVFVFQREFQKKYKKPPIKVVLHDQLDAGLVGLTFRLAGPPVREASTEQIMHQFLMFPPSETILFVIWDPRYEKHSAFRRLVDLERESLTFVHPSADFELSSESSPFNPEGSGFVCYQVKDDESIVKHTTDFDLEGDFDEVFPKLRKFVDSMKLLRPGHEHDALTKMFVQDYPLREITQRHCDERRTKNGERGMFTIVGKNLATQRRFLHLHESPVDIGGLRGDLPSSLTRKGLADMCPTMRRKVILPPGEGYEKGNEPRGVDTDDRLVFHLEFVEWDPTSDDVDGEGAKPPREAVAQEEDVGKGFLHTTEDEEEGEGESPSAAAAGGEGDL